jgi:predicted ArsR family transcriptional regulator
VVLVVLASYAHDDGLAWPGIRCLARAAGMGVSCVRRHLATLVAMGLVEIKEAGRGTRPTLYFLPWRADLARATGRALAVDDEQAFARDGARASARDGARETTNQLEKKENERVFDLAALLLDAMGENRYRRYHAGAGDPML